jgi:hypothetical protein
MQNFAEENQLLEVVCQIYRISSSPLEVIFKSLESAIKNILEMDRMVLKLRNILINSLRPLLYCKVPTSVTIFYFLYIVFLKSRVWPKKPWPNFAEETQLLDLVYQIYRISSPLEVIFLNLQ